MIYLSAGHYPQAAGACFEGFCEHAEAVRWVNELSGLLDGDCHIVPTGKLQSKVRYINAEASSDDIAVEIHFNSAIDDQGKHVGTGCETLYMPGSDAGLDLASAVQNRLKFIFPPGRGVKEGWYQMNPAKGADYFLVHTVCTAIIVEPEFIHHQDKIQNLRTVACHAIAEALR